MKPPLWLLLHAAAHASMASKEQLFLLVTEPRSGSDWLVDLLDAHPNVCVPAGRWAEKGSAPGSHGRFHAQLQLRLMPGVPREPQCNFLPHLEVPAPRQR